MHFSYHLDLRILPFKTRKTPLKSLYKAFDVLKFKDLHYLNICCMVHKFIHSPCLLPEAINDIFRKNKRVHQYNTRQRNDLHPVKISSKLYGEKTISFQGRDYWNKLPSYPTTLTLNRPVFLESSTAREGTDSAPPLCNFHI